MIRTWAADIRPLFEEVRYEKYYRALPDFRKEKADRLRDVRGKAQSVGVWSLLTMVRGTYGVSEETVFNLSHSGNYVICSVDMGSASVSEERMCGSIKLGCDVEEIKMPCMNVARRYFCPSEYETILSMETESERAAAFYRFWVLKESFMKATRLGMALDMQSYEIELSNPPVLLKQPEQFPETYYYQEFELSESVPEETGFPIGMDTERRLSCRDILTGKMRRYRVAICSTEPEMDSEIQTELVL